MPADKITSAEEPIPGYPELQRTIHQAAKANDPGAILLLHRLGRNINEKEIIETSSANHQFTPLYIAALYGSTEAAQCLLALGAEVNTVNPASNHTPLNAAATYGESHPCYQLIKSRGGILNPTILVSKSQKLKQTQHSNQTAEIIRRIVLDIDITLTNAYDDDEEVILRKQPYFQESIDRGLLIDAYYPHILHHGAIEFIQWLASIQNVEIAFFSAGEELRNKAFVSALLQKVLGDQFEKRKESIPVYSLHHLTIEKVKKNRSNDGINFFQTVIDQPKKNLANVFNTDNLDNIILVDDNPSYIAANQLRNVLLTPGATMTSYTLFSDETALATTSPESAILRANHLFYVAGLLATALEMHGDCLANNLFKLQYTVTAHGKYKLNNDLYKNHQFYMKGLAVLQKINPALEFYGGEIALNFLRQSSTLPHVM